MAISKSEMSLVLLQWGWHGLSGEEGLERRARLRKMEGEGSGGLEYPQSERELLRHSGGGVPVELTQELPLLGLLGSKET